MNPDGKTVTLTGATGFLGSSIMVTLLRQGYSLNIPGRQHLGKSLEKRINNLLEWYSCGDLAGKVKLYETDFSKPELGLSDADYSVLCSGHPPVIHCASDTSFAEKNRGRVMASNVHGLKNILKLIQDSSSEYFHYISTAYSAGLVQGTVREAPVSASGFTNVYEESKCVAEIEVAAFCAASSVPYTIIRPSVVYGDSQNGRALKFNALYYPVKSVQYIRDIYINDIKNHGGIKSAQYGITFDENGYLNLPIRIFLPNEGRINLVPVDYFTGALLRIIGNPVSGGIYHITSDSPPDMATLLEYTERFLKIKGMEVVYSVPDSTMMRNPPEELFDHFIKPYRPYLSDRRMFENKNTSAATGGMVSPEFTFEIFSRCMEYAISVEWGKEFREF